MKNCGWLVVIVVFSFAFMFTACGSGDGTNGDNGTTSPDGSSDAGTVTPGHPTGPTGSTGVTCGNGVCETGEGCTSCVDDCACDATDFKACRNDACVDWDSINPLLKKIPGHWVRVEPPNANTQADVTVDPSDIDCYHCLISLFENPNPNPNEPGDACINGLRGGGACLVLHGSSIRIIHPSDNRNHAEGQVLNDGTRMEYVYTRADYPDAWERQ